MKKILIAAVAMMTLLSCSKDQTLELNQEAIGFSETFINNSVKSVNDPSFSSAEGGKMFTDFAVFGYVEGAVLFDGVQVSKEITNGDLKSSWKYSGTQYWIAGANYNFNAVAPMTNGGWTKTEANKDATTLSFTNNGTTDLLYATTSQQGKVSGNTNVAFTFRHVLSKVKFSFLNNYNASNATIKVKDVKINNAYENAKVVLDDNTTWSDQSSPSLILDFGMATDDESTTATKENPEIAFAFGKTYETQNERFLIPSLTLVPTQVVNENNVIGYHVSFIVELLVSGTKVGEYAHNVYVNFKPAAGKSYDIKAEINASNIDPNHAQEPIEFTVNSLPGWGDIENKKI